MNAPTLVARAQLYALRTATMKVITWNVNSVRIRHQRLLDVLERHRPDAICLQELKVEEKDFPLLDVTSLGYRTVMTGQKTYNGVAILSRAEPSDVMHAMDDGVDDPQARLIAATIDGVRVVSVYVPNGGAVDSDKYVYKLAWLDRLQAWLETRCRADQPLVVCGDFNIAPTDDDVNRLEEWSDTVLCTPAVRDRFRKLLAWGLVDTFRSQHAEAGHYSWWDYRMLGFPKNNGLRIDHILATTSLASACTGAEIDRNERKGKQPSDHAPVIATFAR